MSQRKITIAPAVSEPVNTAAFVETAKPAAAETPTPTNIEAAQAAQTIAATATNTAPAAEPAKPISTDNTPTNVTKISFAGLDEEQTQTTTAQETAAQQQQPVKPKIEDILKDFQKEDLYKALGLDEHDIKFSEFRKKGGNPYDYIKQKAIDYTKVPDEVLLKDKLREKYPTLEAQDIDDLFNDTYGQDENAEERTNRLRSIRTKADAYDIRQEKIKQQQANDFPTIQVQAPAADEQGKEKNNNLQLFVDYVRNDDPVKAFMAEKKLKIDLGNGKFHTFEVENPKHLVDAIVDSKIIGKYGNNAQGKPDTQLMLEQALFRINPQLYRNALVEHGRSLALLDELLKDGQNATQAVGKAPTVTSTAGKKITPSNSRITTHG